MPRFDELLGVVTFAAAGMIAAVSLVPVPNSTPPAEPPVVSAAAASTSPAPVAHQPKT
jgi:hypothetical protein